MCNISLGLWVLEREILSFAVVQSLSCVRLSATSWTVARQVSQSVTISQSLLKLMSIESVMPSNHLILCRPLLLLPSIFPSIRVFSNDSALRIRWPKYWSFSFIISPSNEHSALISFRMDWLDLLAVQGTLKSLLQHHSSLSILKLSSHPTTCWAVWLQPMVDPKLSGPQSSTFCHSFLSCPNSWAFPNDQRWLSQDTCSSVPWLLLP